MSSQGLEVDDKVRRKLKPSLQAFVAPVLNSIAPPGVILVRRQTNLQRCSGSSTQEWCPEL